jgi:protein gp37
MGRETNISWTDATFNCWWGCTKVSPGCDHCYAETFDKRVGGAHWGKGMPRRVFGDEHWDKPLKWNKKAQADGVKVKVFCASMADVMDDEAPEGQRERLWELIDQTPYLIWQLLTKRPQRYMRYLPIEGFKHQNAMLGFTAENQSFYNSRWPYVRLAADELGLQSFVSYEPALGRLSMEEWAASPRSYAQVSKYPSWLIYGGETGGNRRPMELAWAENIKAECERNGVSFWMKQMSASTSKKAAALIPAHMLIHQFPAVPA